MFIHATLKLLLGVCVDGFEMFGPTVGMAKRSEFIRTKIWINARGQGSDFLVLRTDALRML